MGAEAGSYTYKWPRPSVTVDTCIVAANSGSSSPQVLLIQRKNEPFAGSWCLPGGFVDEGERLHDAAARELQEETSVDPSTVLLTQVGAFGDPGRDPRGWCVTVAYAALVPGTELGVKAADDAAHAQWYDVATLPRLAFDHKLVVRECFAHIAKSSEAEEAGIVESLRQAVENLAGDWREQ